MNYRISLSLSLFLLAGLQSLLFISSEGVAQSAESWSQARELLALSKRQTPSSQKEKGSQESFFFKESSPNEASFKGENEAFKQPDFQKAEEILDAVQKPALKKAATFVEEVSQGPRCQAPPLADLIESETEFGRSRSHPPVLVFVTLSMRDEVLKTLYREVSKIGGRLVIRGLIDNSFAKTRERLMELKIGAEIDPPAFEAFNVKRVPTFVYVGKDVKETAKTPPHDRLQGNVSLVYALEQFKKSGEIPGAGDYLTRLGGFSS